MYHAPNGAFSVPAPVSFGGHYVDGKNFVVFADDFMEMYRIDYGILPADLVKRFSVYPLREQLKTFVHETLVAALRREYPGATMEHEEWLEDRKSHFLVITLPRGSAYTVNGRREDVQHGVLVFGRNKRLFLLHTQIARNPPFSTKPLTMSERLEALKKALLNLQSSMRFGQ